ncbi:hypothetical protein B0H66DRAFT_580220 [Apodospora peruviana]|uniref:Uncharacterized protein n=1 Tax=Apodospora peruviana TaxID=516989 RepID=A0AAE0IUG3_9PEZI|nr:hypothetical protein B0H66DRAFT_580220 [Apodospora peruviana]
MSDKRSTTTEPAPPPPPPSPSPPRLPAGRPAASSSQTRPQTSPQNAIGIGIETGFLLDERKPGDPYKSLKYFARSRTDQYNASIGKLTHYPRMHSLVMDQYRGEYQMRYTEWALHHGVIEMVSPVLTAGEGREWRDKVSKMWSFLKSTYNVSANSSCRTMCTSHLEVARGNEYSWSNWIHNLNLAYKDLSRAESMLAIEACKTERDVVNLMNSDGSKYFGFNFLSLEPPKTIEFCRGATSTTVQDVFKWVRFSMAFLQASIRLPDRNAFDKFQPTIGGIKMFFDNAELVEDPGMNQRKHRDLLFHGSNPGERKEPTPVKLETLSKVKREKLEEKTRKDKGSHPMLDRLSDAKSRGII